MPSAALLVVLSLIQGVLCIYAFLKVFVAVILYSKLVN